MPKLISGAPSPLPYMSSYGLLLSYALRLLHFKALPVKYIQALSVNQILLDSLKIRYHFLRFEETFPTNSPLKRNLENAS
jgi:hypothetical protein